MTLVREYQPTFVLGDGVTKEFSFLFEEVSANFVKVIVKHSDNSTYVPVFSVDLDSHKVVFGESETAPLDTDVVCIYRETPDLQDTPFRTLQGYDAKALENILSKIVAMIQEIKASGFSTQILQGTPWQLDLLQPADDNASVVIDYNARILKKGLYFQIVSGNLQVSADGSSFITMPKSADITEFRCLETVLEDLTVIRKLQYKVSGVWYDAESNAQATADEALALAQTVQSDLSSHNLNHNNPHETSLSNLTDTDIQGLITGQFLQYDGIKWKNVNNSSIVSWGSLLGDITDQTDLMTEFAKYVRTDGSSTMTNPLMMRATEDFKCAIAPYWDGVGFFKLNDNNSVTLMASIEYNSGFEPATTNTYDIGASARKWKNLYLSGKAYMSVINNGYDIAVPVTNSADTLALKSEVDTAANSGRMITDTGVWFAKMYAASTVPTGAEYEGTNYADFSQVDSDNNPIIVIYEYQSDSWVETERVTPPANYDGYVPVTKKMWDIIEQTGQQGGRVLWNHQSKQFTPYPNIVDLSDVATTDMDNLTSTGQNIANWSSNVSNCITEIPQDIKLELSSDGTLTLKAGSKLYVPNGVGVFDTFIVETDLLDSTWGSGSTDLMVAFDTVSSTLHGFDIPNCHSGPTAPTGATNMLWYDTTNNKVKQTSNSGSTWNDGWTLPICIVSRSSGTITGIDQVFNGFGYIGSTKFALPRVSGLIPDGFNSDGTLKNIPFVIENVLTTTGASTDTTIGFIGADSLANHSAPTYRYDPKTNLIVRNSDGVPYSSITGVNRIPFTKPYHQTNGKIEYCSFYNVFNAVDYNDTEFIAHQAMPSNRTTVLTAVTSGGQITAPADGYISARATPTGAGQFLELMCGVDTIIHAHIANQDVAVFIPVSKGAIVTTYYSTGTPTFTFVYANGAQ